MTAPVSRIIGRYALHGEIASGGMATVYFGRLLGPVAFSRTVAIKQLHPHFAKDPEFVAMFLDEARLAARVRHPNVVPTIDVVALEGELFLVLEYVEGESLARLMRAAKDQGMIVPLPIVSAIIGGVLHGLHAAHEAKDERGSPLSIVHRDVSPHNVLVGIDGVARVLDFGVAKAAGRLHTTREGQLKGKLPYMSAEQIRGNVARTTDIYACGVVLWEMLVGRRLFSGDEATVLACVLTDVVSVPSSLASHVPPALDALTMRAIDRDPAKRFPTAREMARALEKLVPPATAADVGEWVEVVAARSIAERSRRIAAMEGGEEAPAPTMTSLPTPTPLHEVQAPAPVARAEAPTAPDASDEEKTRQMQAPAAEANDLAALERQATVASDMSSISVSTPQKLGLERRRFAWILAAVSAVALAVAVAVVLSTDRAPDAPDAATRSAAEPTPPATRAEPAPEPPAPATATAAPEPSASATVAAAAIAVGSNRPARARPAATARPAQKAVRFRSPD